LHRLITIVEAVSQEEISSATVISERVGLSLSTTARLIRELQDEGLLDRIGENGAYVPGARLVALAGSATQPLDVVEAATPVMQDLRDSSGETVSLHIRRQYLRLCVAQIESRHQVRRVMPIGFISPLHGSATSEVLLAGMGPTERTEYYDDSGVVAAERRQIELRLEEIHQTGWAFTADLVEEGLAGISIPVKVGGRTVASLSISGPSSRWTTSVMEAFATRAVAASETIARRFSGHHNIPNDTDIRPSVAKALQ
jgi:DNA-binding IclR family transcriptional regulator